MHAELPCDERRENGSDQLDDGVAGGNRRATVRALATQQQITDDGNVLRRGDHRATFWARGARDNEVVALSLRRRCRCECRLSVATQDLLGLRFPFALEHDRYALDDDIEKAVDE